MALATFPGAQVKVLLADSEVSHEGKIDDKDGFLRAIATTKSRVITKYPEVQASTFFEEAGGMTEFAVISDYFYKALRAKVRINYERAESREVDRKLSILLRDQASGTGGKLAGRGVNVPQGVLEERILRNTFAEMLVIGELIRRRHSELDGTCSAAIVFDQSEVTSLINSGEKHGSSLKNGTAPIPLILANSVSAV